MIDWHILLATACSLILGADADLKLGHKVRREFFRVLQFCVVLQQRGHKKLEGTHKIEGERSRNT